MKSFGLYIREERLKQGKTQKEIAESLGISAGSVQQYETNKITPTKETLKKFVEYFDIPQNVAEKFKTSQRGGDGGAFKTLDDPADIQRCLNCKLPANYCTGTCPSLREVTSLNFKSKKERGRI